MKNNINIGVIGYGVVGQGAVQALIQNKQSILNKSGININILAIADRSIAKKENKFSSQVKIKTTDIDALINNKDIDIIVELIGGTTLAKEVITKAIKAKKHVVTANKALLALHGEELVTLAEEHGVEIAFEASVGGGIPIIKILKEDLAANDILEIEAIINGTANYILSKMTQEKLPYEDVLKEAQRLGYAEADPTFDVEGIDTGHKLTLLSSVAFGTWIDFNNIYIEGITQISSLDIAFAEELDCVIKLLAIARMVDDKIDVRVHPTMIPSSSQLANVNGAYNAVKVVGNIVGTTMFYGMGAGSLPTGSAIAADVINLSRNIISDSTQRVPIMGYAKKRRGVVDINGMDNIFSKYYLRLTVKDEPGVLACIAGIMAKNNISIKNAIQKSDPDNNNIKGVPLVFLTHMASEEHMRLSLQEINTLECTLNKTVCIRVLD